MEGIGRVFKFKKGKNEPPESYLGARLRKKSLDGVDMWTMSSYDYVVAAVKNVNKMLQGNTEWKLPKNVPTPMTSARWNMAAGVVDVSWIPEMLNLADCLTKQLTLEKRGCLY
ncbi:unnamed protein product [Cylindrotheca closterium]|uniref:Uncharacterized protein n=1 Tax=Cylindrotheca closterium TaxID=2856 RepID=A0AAD2FDB4_9STRA|nr:unnamed protein product [Cylindrotheca closterium]